MAATMFEQAFKAPKRSDAVKDHSADRIADEIATLDAESAKVLEAIRGML
jgi:hypothetical protein